MIYTRIMKSPHFPFGPALGLGGWIRRGLGLLGFKRGSHGYSRELPEMAGIFYALGRGVRAGQRLEAPEAIDIAPTVAVLLGISPPRDCEGRVIPRLGLSR